jgi:glycosyltransferase involved in cell wall biosynthesis
MRVVVVEPDPCGRTSGGYLYNQRLAEHGAFELVRATSGAPPRIDALRAEAGAVVLADSLFLEPDRLTPFLALRGQGVCVGMMLHAFPSFVRRAANRTTLAHELPLAPLPSELELIARLDVVVTPGSYVARVLTAAGSNVRCVVCSPGVDEAHLASSEPSSPTVRLLAIANLTPAKGILDALEALTALRELPWQLTLVGALDAEVTHVAELRMLVAQRNLDGRVRFCGARSHAETLAMLHESDLLVVSSYTENCPLVALEAAKAGVPVVGYAVGGLPDLVESGVTGRLVPLLDISALAAALRDVIESPTERRRLAGGAAVVGSALPTWRDAAAAFQRALLPYRK